MIILLMLLDFLKLNIREQSRLYRLQNDNIIINVNKFFEADNIREQSRLNCLENVNNIIHVNRFFETDIIREQKRLKSFAK